MPYPDWTLLEVINEDFHELSRHVEFGEANFQTYSIDLLRLYLSICSEIDVVAKMLCERERLKLPKRPNMDHYRSALRQKYPNLPALKIEIKPREVIPWEIWTHDLILKISVMARGRFKRAVWERGPKRDGFVWPRDLLLPRIKSLRMHFPVISLRVVSDLCM